MWCSQIQISLQRVAEAKNKNLRVVVASGCFDILHVGHIRYLQEAKKLGDYLVVFISDDMSVKMIKGHRRPIIPEQERKEMLMAIKGVDDVIVHRQNDFISLLRETHPAFFVKGKDYGEGDFRWLESYTEQVALVGYAPTSTSQIINKCLDHYSEGS